jgi:Protein involved in polysaccharide intercellular adhesin (PIA) synthesis/biofilm formation
MLGNMTKSQGEGGSFFAKDALSLENTRPLRMVLVIFIFTFHLTGHFGIGRDIGHVLVAVFFMLSGYGLMYSMDHKGGYLKSFLPKRFPTLYIPTVICGTAMVILSALVYPGYDYMKEFFEIFFLRPEWWFVTALMLLYMTFYLSFLFFRGRNAVIAVIILSITFTLMLSEFTNDIIYYASISGFFVGILWYYGQDRIAPFMKKYYVVVFLILVLLLVLSNVERDRIVGIKDLLLTNVAPLIFTLLLIVTISAREKLAVVVIGFVLLMAIVVSVVKLEFPEVIYYEADILLFELFVLAALIRIPYLRQGLAIGSIVSFEIFLIHDYIFKMVIYSMSPDIYVTALIAGVSTVILSIVLYFISDRILKEYNKAFDRLGDNASQR